MEDHHFEMGPFPEFGFWNNITSDATEYAEEATYGDTDLYVVGDLYENYVKTPTVIAVPRRKIKVNEVYTKENEETKSKWRWGELEAPVEEDLYKVSPGNIPAAEDKRSKEFLFKLPASRLPQLNRDESSSRIDNLV
ncbi:hypothetical protein OROGR_027890 [Orobanche gracilis]